MPDDSALRIKESLDRIGFDSSELACDFYRRLFERAPDIREMFNGDIRCQAIRMDQTIKVSAANAGFLWLIAPGLRKLGAQHAELGATPEQYAVLVDVLLETIEAHHGAGWEEAHRKAWEAALGQVVRVMLDGASAPRRRRPDARTLSS